jgi:hypothetical protein
LQLVRPDLPLRATWAMRGGGPDRYPGAGMPIVARVYPTGRANSCLSGFVFEHAFATEPQRYRLSGGPRPLEGVLKPTRPRPFELPVNATHTTTFMLNGQPRAIGDGELRGPTLFGLTVGACRRR